MANNAQKQPFTRNLHDFGDNKALQWNQQNQQPIPCTVTAIDGSLVEVKFDVDWKFTVPKIKIPKAQSNWAREPTQVGDKGFVTFSSLYLGGQSGLGGGTADGYYRGNLTSVVFQPITNKKFTTVSDQNSYYIFGPTGAVMQDTDGNNVVKAKKDEGLSLKDQYNNTINTRNSGIAATDSNGNSITTSSSGVDLEDKFGNSVKTLSTGLALKDLHNNQITTNAAGLSLQDDNGNSLGTSSTGVQLTSASGGDVNITPGTGGMTIQDANGSIVQMTPTQILIRFGASGSIQVLLNAGGALIQDGSGNGIAISPGVIAIEAGGAGTVFLGGDGSTGTYHYVSTSGGNSINVKARTA